MSEGDFLLRWLVRAAGRRRLNERLQDAVWLVITLLALAIVYQTLHAGLNFTRSADVILPLFLAGGAFTMAYFGWRMASGPILTQAASSADTRAGLNDELRSALWFAPFGTGDRFIRTHLDHATRTVQRLDVRQLFPFVMPRNVPVAIVLALFAGALLWVSPHIESAVDDSRAARSTDSRRGVIIAGESVAEEEEIEAEAAARGAA